MNSAATAAAAPARGVSLPGAVAGAGAAARDGGGCWPGVNGESTQAPDAPNSGLEQDAAACATWHTPLLLLPMALAGVVPGTLHGGSDEEAAKEDAAAAAATTGGACVEAGALSWRETAPHAEAPDEPAAAGALPGVAGAAAAAAAVAANPDGPGPRADSACACARGCNTEACGHAGAALGLAKNGCVEGAPADCARCSCTPGAGAMPAAGRPATGSWR